MRVIKWEPFRDIDDAFDRFFAETVRRWPQAGNERRAAQEWAPAADVSETDAEYLIKADLPFQVSQSVKEARLPRATDMSQLKASRTDLLSQANARTQQPQVTQPIRVEKKVGRNDLCPCGSGKKYKHCHGQ